MTSHSDSMDDYLEKKDWNINENANINYSLGGLILHNNASVTREYYLNKIYSKEIADSHTSCQIHIHDLAFLAPYCAGWSLRQLIEEGLGGVESKVSSGRALHLTTLIRQMIDFLAIMQKEWSGAQSFSSFDTYLAPFVKKDSLSEKQVKDCMESFVYGINTVSSRLFVNITLDWKCPCDLKNTKAIVGGVKQDFTYGDCQNEMDLINKVFIEVMTEGDYCGRGFAYPIPTYNITKDFDYKSDNARLLYALTCKYGTPYFQNFVNSDLNPQDVRSMCCRLRLDKRELRKRGGGLFGSDEFTGSIGVVTINLPQIGYLADSTDDFYARLDYLMEIAKESLCTKRKIMEYYLDKGLYPYTKRYLKNFDNHFNTIGICGMNECCLNFLHLPISDDKGRSFAIKVLSHINEKLKDYQETTGLLFNLEATPAESTCYRFALHDKETYPDIITSGDTQPFYTNSTQLSVDYTQDIFEALDHQEPLQTMYTGGTVFHAYIGEQLSDIDSCGNLIKTIFSNYRLPYLTISPVYSICPDHGYIKGQEAICPVCGKETEIYSRIVGYYRNIKNWNKGKKEEYRLRKNFNNIDTIPTAEDKKLFLEGSSILKDLTYRLYIKKGCKFCTEIKDFISKMDFTGTLLDAESSDNYDKVVEDGIIITPTLILFNKAGQEIARCNSKEEFESILTDTACQDNE